MTMQTQRESFDSKILKWAGVAMLAFLLGSFVGGTTRRAGAGQGFAAAAASAAPAATASVECAPALTTGS